MSEGNRVGLDNPYLSSRVRSHSQVAGFTRRPVQSQVRRSVDGFVLQKPQIVINISSISSKTQKISKQHTSRGDYKLRPAAPRQTRSEVLARNMVRPKAKKRKKHMPRHLKVSKILLSFAALTFIGGGVSYMSWRTNHHIAAQVNVLSSSIEAEQTDVPVEEEVTPDLLAAYKVEPDNPRIVKIPRLEVNARVKELAMKSPDVLATPSSIYDTGWYDSSSKPGESGAVLINGFVQGPTKPGVFYRLSNLKEGDTIEVEKGDGMTISYKVVALETIDRAEVNIPKLLKSVDPSKPGLNLISYTERYDIRTNKYEKRLVVYAVQQ